MDREALRRLSRDELIELVVRLTEMVAAAGQQQERLAALDRRLAEVQAEVERLSAPPKTSENSSVPPSVGFKANRTERRRRRGGAKRGHAGTSRRRQRPDVIVRCRPSQCQGCGEPLPLDGQRRVGRSQVVELPPIRPVVVEAWQYAARCQGCGVRTKGTYPAGLEPTRTFRPGIETLLGYFHERHHVGYERLVEVRRDVF